MRTPVSVAPHRQPQEEAPPASRLLHATCFFFLRKSLNKLRPVSPLMAAAAAGSEMSVRWLLAAGACADLT